MSRISIGTHHLPDQVSSSDPAASKGKSQVFSRQPDSGEKLAGSVAKTLSKVRDNSGKKAVKEVASPVLDSRINNWPSGKVSENIKFNRNFASNHEIKVAYRNFLTSSPSKRQHEMAVLNLDKQISKLNKEEELNPRELENVAESMLKIIDWLRGSGGRQMTLDKLTSLESKCENIYAKALKQLPKENALEIIRKRNIGSNKAELQPGINNHAETVKNPEQYMHFMQTIQKNIKNSKVYSSDIIIEKSAVAYVKLDESRNINAENILKEFENQISDQNLQKFGRLPNAAEKETMKQLVLDSFKEADRLYPELLINFENAIKDQLENFDDSSKDSLPYRATIVLARSAFLELHKDNDLDVSKLVYKFKEKIKNIHNHKTDKELTPSEILKLTGIVIYAFAAAKN